MPKIQEWIYQLEEGQFGRVFQIVVVGVALLVLAVIFHLREYTNLSHPSAMDMAQVGRSIQQGEGFSTKNVRPFAIYMVDRQHVKKNRNSTGGSGNEGNESKLAQSAGSQDSFPASQKFLSQEKFPDLSHPPLYPLFLSGLFNILPFDHNLDLNDNNSFIAGKFRYQPEVLLSIVQTFFLVLAVALTFLVAFQLFDGRVAALSAVVMLLHNYFWSSIFSGLPTLILVNLTLLLGFFLSVAAGKWESLANELASHLPGAPLELKEDFIHSIILMTLAGLVMGIGGLIDYCYLWLIVPTIALAIFCAPRWKIALSVIPLCVAMLVMAPWFIRNMDLTGNPFGIAGHSVFQSTQAFPYNSLDSQLSPDSGAFTIELIAKKFVAGLGDSLDRALGSVGGLMVVAFFLVGLFLPFRSAKLNHLRYWTLVSFGILIAVSSLVFVNYGSMDTIATPYELASWLSPFIVIFSVGCFFVVTDQIELELVPMRRVFPIIFALLAALPLVWTVLPPSRLTALPLMNTPGRISPSDSAIAPYDIFKMQSIGSWFRGGSSSNDRQNSDETQALGAQAKASEMIMTDMPWAYAWYANKPAFAIASTQREESIIHLGLRRVHGLYLTEMSLMKSFDEVFSIRNGGWSNLIQSILLEGKAPNDFHMIHTPYLLRTKTKEGYPMLANQIFLASYPRWPW